MKLTDKVYDTLKWIAQLVLPALGTLYFTLSGIWGFPYGEQIVGTIMAIDTFLGVILRISTGSYQGDGAIVYSDDEDVYLNLETEVDDLANKNLAIFRIQLPKK